MLHRYLENPSSIWAAESVLKTEIIGHKLMSNNICDKVKEKQLRKNKIYENSHK